MPSAGSWFHAWQQLHQQPDAENDRDQNVGLIHTKRIAAETDGCCSKKYISTKALSTSPLKGYERSEGIETPSSHGRDQTPGMPGVFTEIKRPTGEDTHGSGVQGIREFLKGTLQPLHWCFLKRAFL